MKINTLLADSISVASELLALVFHKRNVIIVSEHKVKHVPVSCFFQGFFVFFAVVGFCWAVYSTGSFISTQSILKEQTEALKSFVGNKIENSFVFATPSDSYTHVAGPKTALSSVENMDLYSRIADLESKLQESEKSKKAFVDQVRLKTASNINTMENLIEQTGLDISSLKRQIPADSGKEKEAVSSRKLQDAQGGPYIPAETKSLTSHEIEVISKLDELKVLNTIISNLPVRKPIYGFQEMSQFGRRIDPFTGRLAFHSGIDLAGPADSKIFATADGKVSFAGRSGAYGNMIDVDHGFNITTRYGHLNEILIEEGAVVKKGQVIGIQGSTGRSTGAHLHYEVRYNDQPMNPRNFLNAGLYVPKS